jgi:hypothetical protein
MKRTKQERSNDKQARIEYLSTPELTNMLFNTSKLNSVHGCCWCSQVQNLLLAYGSLKTFTLVKDPTTGQSAGQAYCEYVDASATEGAVSGLSTTVVAGAPLMARRVVRG